MVAGRYRMVGLLGRGGMGEVYRADDLKLGQPVALKFLPEALERDPARLERFLNEVRLSLRVTHSNVCRVFDIGQIDGPADCPRTRPWRSRGSCAQAWRRRTTRAYCIAISSPPTS